MNPIIQKKKSWTEFYYTPSQTPRTIMHIYKGGILKTGDTGRSTRCSRGRKPQNNYTKGENLIKTTKTGKIPTVLAISGQIRYEEPPWQSTPRSDALESARENMQTVRTTSWTGGKRACFISLDITQKNLRSLGTTEKNTWAYGLTRKTAKAADKREEGLWISSTATSRSKKSQNQQNAQILNIVITHWYYRGIWTPVEERQSSQTFESYWTAVEVQQSWLIIWNKK